MSELKLRRDRGRRPEELKECCCLWSKPHVDSSKPHLDSGLAMKEKGVRPRKITLWMTADSREAGGWNQTGGCDYTCNEVGEGIQDPGRILLVHARVVSLTEGKGSEEERPVNWEQESSLGAPDVVPRKKSVYLHLFRICHSFWVLRHSDLSVFRAGGPEGTHLWNKMGSG